jgi:hypothetical protein
MAGFANLACGNILMVSANLASLFTGGIGFEKYKKAASSVNKRFAAFYH